MGFRINTNIAAMNSHRNAMATNAGLDKSLNSLSSGLRINKAADDASGMTIADSLRSQAQGLGQAINNANDGVAVVQTADGALDEYINIINTVRTKAIQAASDGQNTDSRAAIQADIDRLLEAANGIANTTQFNGQKLLDGTFTNKAFHIGAYAGETVSLSVGNVQVDSVGSVTSSVGASTRDAFVNATDLSESATGYSLAAEALTINGVDVSSSINTLSPTRLTDAASVAAAITDATGLTTDASNTFTAASAILGGSIAADSLKINGVAIAATTVSAADADGALVRAINDITDQTGVTASLDANKKLVLESADGSNISITTSTVTAADPQVNTATITGAISAGTISYTVGTTAAVDVAYNASHAQTMADLVTSLEANGITDATYVANQTETVTYAAADLTVGQVLEIDGLTITATGGTATAADIATALRTGATVSNAAISGTASGDWTLSGAGANVIYTSTTANTNVADLTVTSDQSTGSLGAITQGAAESLSLEGAADGTAFTIAFDTSAATGLTSITNAVTTVGVAAIATGSDTVTGLTADHLTSVDSGVVAGLTSSNAAALDIAEGDLVINGVDMAGTYGDNSTLGGARAALEAAIQAIDGLGDSSINALGVIKLIANDGQDLNIAGVDADATHTFKLAEGVTNQSAAGTVEIFSKEAVTVGGNAETSFGLTEGTSKVTDNGASLDSIDVTSRNSAEIGILIADSALKSLDATRSDLGSVQNQLESTIRNISVTQVNVTAAESQIRDVDFAAESANFAKLNILAQSGSYAMSQANAVQQNVLRLLQ